MCENEYVYVDVDVCVYLDLYLYPYHGNLRTLYGSFYEWGGPVFGSNTRDPILLSLHEEAHIPSIKIMGVVMVYELQSIGGKAGHRV